MRTTPRLVIASAAVALALVSTEAHIASQELANVASLAAGHADLDALRRWDATVDSMARTGQLVPVSRVNDPSLEGRAHDYLAQHHAGIPVHGAGVSRQRDRSGVTVSLFGTLHRAIDVDTTPALSAAEVVAVLEQPHGGAILAGGQPRLVILPLLDGSYALTYMVPMTDLRFYFADADDGRVVHVMNAVMSKSAVGTGTGHEGDRKKLSTTHTGSRFEAWDILRPGEIVTLDAGSDGARFNRLVAEHMQEGLPPGEPSWTSADIAADADNEWDDPTVVDIHAYTGWMYDYLFERHRWEGLDGENGRILSIVNPGYPTAFFASPPYGPEGTGAMGYGTPWTDLDTVGHEMMHGVTHLAVSRRTGSDTGLVDDVAASIRLGPTSFIGHEDKLYTCDTTRVPVSIPTPGGPETVSLPTWCVDGRFVIGSAEGGALHESYSDIFAQAVEFFHEDTGVTADYAVSGGAGDQPIIRFPPDPQSLPLFQGYPFLYPDHYRDRYEFSFLVIDIVAGEKFVMFSPFVFVNGEHVFELGVVIGYGGSHWNSTILSHAFYLAIEGGTHRTSGMTVDGVGGERRAEIERIFFRAMTHLMPAAGSLRTASAVIRQSAADLAPGSDAERAVDEALRAVGLPPAVLEAR